jgi:hypothetical protein
MTQPMTLAAGNLNLPRIFFSIFILNGGNKTNTHGTPKLIFFIIFLSTTKYKIKVMSCQKEAILKQKTYELS